MASHDVVTPRVGERSLGSTLSEVSDEKGYLASDAHRVEDGHLPGSKESLDKDPLIHDEVKEVVPDQAFKWNVDGDQSPFPEVAANVPNTDDPTIQVNNVRMWFLLTCFVIIFAGVNTFFNLRYPSLTMGYVVAQLLVFPLGKAWAWALPDWKIGFGRASFRLNPGPFSIKEHAVIVICVSLTSTPAYGLPSLVAIQSEHYWGKDWGAGFGFLFILTSQMLGFGLAGLARRWIVYPAALIWPSTLSSTALFRALHEKTDFGIANGWSLSRYRFFAYFTIFAFVTFWFPDYIATCLSSFAFLTWIWPRNQKVNTIFGMNSGLGLLPISFDWTVINYAGQPLMTPFYITANCFATIVIFYLLLAPILYYKNVWNSAYLPLLSSSTYDHTGAIYNVSRVIDHKTLDFNTTAYHDYSPMYISMSYSLSYALSFAAVTAMIVYTALWNGKDIIAKLRNSRAGGEDVHKRLMNAYREVPDWWYGVLTAVVVGLGILTIRYWPTELPVWGFIVFCFGLGALLIIPEGILEGTTNQRVFLNIITELIAGYIWPGKAIANIMVKTFGYNSVKHGLDFAADLKLGQYMKIAPRLLFVTQIYSSVLSCATQIGVWRWMLRHIENLCDPTNANRFTCANGKVLYNASVIWGTIGPQRMFQSGQTYNAIMYFFLIGPVVTGIVYLVYRRYPNSWVKYINPPIFFNAAGNIPPANTTQYSLWFIFGFIFNHLIRRRAFAWWKRYNYLLQASMDTGVALATIIIFFTLSYTNTHFSWALNNVGKNTYDAKGVPWLKVKNGTHFGPNVGEF